MAEPQFHCKFCGGGFVRESAFMKHRCKPMQRDEELRTPLGQSAWGFYKMWMTAQRHIIPPSTSFLKSKYYGAFIRFAQQVKRLSMPEPDTFIWLMVKKEYPPVMWVDPQVLTLFLEFLERKGDPYRRAQDTIDTLFDIAEAADCDIHDVFDAITPAELVQLLKEQRLSPWILLKSKQFMKFFVETANEEEQLVIQTVIRPKFWSEKFDKNPEVVDSMLKYIKELNL